MKITARFVLNGATSTIPVQELSGWKGARYRFHWKPRDSTNIRVGQYVLDGKDFDLSDPEDVARFNFVQHDLIGTHQRFPFPIAEVTIVENDPVPDPDEPDAPDVEQPPIVRPVPENPDTITVGTRGNPSEEAKEARRQGLAKWRAERSAKIAAAKALIASTP